VRRTPEEARALILAACGRLLMQRGPSEVGLVDVAREAAVSHALVTHYFGTIDALVDAALDQFVEAERQRLLSLILERPDATPREWMEQWFELRNRPEVTRILAWSFLTEQRKDFFGRRMRGAQRVVDAIETRLGGAMAREKIEFALLLVLSATHGYALGKTAYWPSLGHDKVGKAEDRFFFDRLADVIEAMLPDPKKR